MSSSPFFATRVFLTFLALPLLLSVWGAASGLIAHLRMHRLPVEVARSSMLIEAAVTADGTPTEINYVLRLDLRALDGSNRMIHWEDVSEQATYPEEAFDFFDDWRTGSRHIIRQVRGEAREFRIEGGATGGEFRRAIALTATAFFFCIPVLLLLTQGSKSDPWLRWFRLPDWAGLGAVLMAIGTGFLIVAVVYLYSFFPMLTGLKSVQAVQNDSPSAYDAGALPEGVAITAAARRYLEERRHRVLAFPHNGRTIHAGIGVLDGVYDDELRAVCPPFGERCTFQIHPTNRWKVIGQPGYPYSLLAPLGLFLALGLGFSRMGWIFRRG